jgi:hypothetical protein
VKGFLIIRLFGNLSDNFIYRALSIDDRIGKTLHSKSFDIVEGIG